MIHSEELAAVAKRVFWFGTPEEALEFPLRFLTYAMAYASDEDIEIIRRYFTDDDFKATRHNPAPGIFDQKLLGEMESALRPYFRSTTSEATHSRGKPDHGS